VRVLKEKCDSEQQVRREEIEKKHGYELEVQRQELQDKHRKVSAEIDHV